ncbi:MAG: diguanylate cyclase [Opitutaceae bacterium]|jgi:two-component system cell cycle response regulator|nr:diguanylate cyclase [Opitutaceae bacterium]
MPPSPKLRKLLLIDDDERQEHLLQLLLAKFRREHFDLEYVSSYEAGLKKLASGNYAVCLLDYHLGERNGLELLREARIAGCDTPVFILTAEDSDELDNAAMEAGAVDYLVKSALNPRLLERSIRYALKLGDTLAQLRQLAQRDELTKLLNRREFSRILNEEWDRSARFQRPFTLVMVDIDFFKKINDTHGHQAGDEVLRHVASLLSGQVRTVDRVARYGGEEFALVMIETDCRNAAEHIRRLGLLLADLPCIVADKDLTIEVTLSAGVADSQQGATSATELVEMADKALYAAKKGGRNRIVTADGTVIPFK